MHAYVGRHITLHTCGKREDKHNGIILFLKLDVNSMLWTQVLRLSQEALYLLSHIPVLKNAFWSKVSTVKCGNVCVCVYLCIPCEFSQVPITLFYTLYKVETLEQESMYCKPRGNMLRIRYLTQSWLFLFYIIYLNKSLLRAQRTSPTSQWKSFYKQYV